MAPRRRPPDDIIRDLKRLAEGASGDRDREALLHEVHVYQEELVVQNEALQETRAILEEARDRFVELYDFAPNGYMTVNEQGVIQQINLTGASWLGRSKQAIEGLPFLAYVRQGDRDAWMRYLRDCRDYRAGGSITVQLRLRAEDGSRYIELLCKPRVHKGQVLTEFFVAMIDVTEQRQLQSEHQVATQARAALAGRLISVQEEERHRIARDLHDNVGQRLAGLRLMLDGLTLDASPDGALKSRVETALRAVAGIDRALDFLAAELRPAALDLGIAHALDQFIEEWASTFGVAAHFHGRDVSIEVSSDTATHLYRIVQEALNNVHKHATASEVHVTLRRRRDGLVVEVEDNGRGFGPDTPSAGSRRGLGLISMRERAELVGAALEVESTPGKGTVIRLRLPAPP